ncbi:hypothetical protein [Marinagarivorans algicola]|uniref:hypothetical protein n=1 Tax=Marinagarivorans algicola TaxID=1513270 RepID=UPI0006B57344|nr:hypothetical protein [Marinagarivorans algicola]
MIWPMRDGKTGRNKMDLKHKSYSGLLRPLARIVTLTAWVVTGVVSVGMTSDVYAQGQYYRYVNEEGVKVLGQSIPPRYVANGYEVISANGRVVQVVEPALDPELVEMQRAQAELKASYELLARRYSTVRDIEAAKQRKLIHVEASILLVEGSIEGIQAEIDDLTVRAANLERAGKVVPNNVLDTLSALNEKMTATQAIYQQRKHEKEEIVTRFTQEKQLFTQGVERFNPEAMHKLQAAEEADDSGSKADTGELEGSSVNKKNEGAQQTLSGL